MLKQVLILSSNICLRKVFNFTKTRKILNSYVRLSLSSAKFNIKKYDESKDNLLDYYNSLGFRDAVIEKDTVYHNAGGNLNIDLQMKEGRKYYFGNINWRGNTKYSDSILSVILNIKKEKFTIEKSYLINWVKHLLLKAEM